MEAGVKNSTSSWNCSSSQLLQLSLSAECIQGEDNLVEEMKTLLGPFASNEKLLSHLRAVRGRVSWAVNRYLREELMSRAIPDFLSLKRGLTEKIRNQNEIKQCSSFLDDSEVIHRLADISNEIQANWLSLPDSIWLHVCSFLTFRDVCQLACSCKLLKEISDSDPIWKGFFNKRWGDTATEKAALEMARDLKTKKLEVEGSKVESSRIDKGAMDVTSGCRGPLYSWQQVFKDRLMSERSNLCPECNVTQFVPIVYGFPSGQLVDGLRKERLVLGGDHLIEYPFYSPIWACLGCGTQWRMFPYAKNCTGPFLFPVEGARLEK